VRNCTAVPFITGDQPVINLDADGETDPKSFSFFYALSPRLALYSGEPGNDIAVPAWIRLDNEVTDLNLRVALASQRQIYAAAAEPLEELRPYLARAS
jgi:hypothetical protein